MDSFIKYQGGKLRLRDRIIKMMPAHKTYVEPFLGAGWVYFGKPQSPAEFINDIDNKLINLYITVRDDLDRFTEILNNTPASEFLFKDFLASKCIQSAPDALVYNACREYYVIMNSFNGNISGRPSFAFSKDKESSFLRFYNTDWDLIKQRLKRTTILSRDYSKLIPKLDGPETLFYLDPPYIVATNKNRYYRHNFTEKDHCQLNVYLSDIRGKFILSYDDRPEIRDLYSDFRVVEVEGIHTTSSELLITNFDPPEVPFYDVIDGIQSPAETTGPRTAWYNKNCPYCGSRRLKKLYERVVLDDDKRSWEAEAFKCKSCDKLINIR